MRDYFNDMLFRYPELSVVEKDIREVSKVLEDCFRNGGTLFIAGNGGSAADSEHLVGELLKGFKLKRELSEGLKNKFKEKFGEEGYDIAGKLQNAFKAVSLTSHPGFGTAFSNDVDADLVFGQQLFALGKEGDVFMGFTTSGNSRNILKAMKVASVQGIKTILMTGASGGKCSEIADYSIKVPETETYKIQELHLPVYHTICLVIEEIFYGKK